MMAHSATTGGGMYNGSSDLTLSNVTFSGNSATNGGGMFNVSSNPTLSNVTFSGNSASIGGGGGMFNQGSNPTLSSVTFSGNSAANGGGMVNTGSNPTLSSVTFSGNSATTGGGMINGTSSPTLTNVTFSGNSATSGGGIYNGDSSPTLRNVTFSSNSASNGGGMLNGGTSSPTLHNVLIANSVSGGDCVNSGSVLNVASSHNLIEDSVSACGLTNGANGNLIGQDPLLGPLADNGGSTQTHALLAGSPAINAGTNTNCPSSDQRGVVRPQGSTCDIGAYEVDLVAPSVTVEQAATQVDPTNAGPIQFTVTFSEDVSGFTDADVTLGGTAGATTGSVSGSGASYTISVSGMIGPGTVIVSLAAGVAQDAAGNLSLASTSSDNTVTYTGTSSTGNRIYLPIVVR